MIECTATEAITGRTLKTAQLLTDLLITENPTPIFPFVKNYPNQKTCLLRAYIPIYFI